MIAIREFADSGNMTQIIFVPQKCPIGTKCVTMNATDSIAFFDTIPPQVQRNEKAVDLSGMVVCTLSQLSPSGAWRLAAQSSDSGGLI